MPLKAWSRLWGRRTLNAASYTRIADHITADAWTEPRLSPAARAAFLDQCWGLVLPGIDVEAELIPFESYLSYYEESCLHLPATMQSFSHADIGAIAQHFANSVGLSHDMVTKTMPIPAHSAATATECVDFVGRAVLLLDLVDWRGNSSLPEFIRQDLAYKSTQKDQFRLPMSFNASTFERIAGTKIVWTHNLSSHLRVGSDMELLNIFHHAKVLDLYEESRFSRIFPSHFIEETRQTLALMMPKGNKVSRDWFRIQQERLGLDASAGSCPYLGEEKRNIQKFHYWRDRLIIAKQVYDEGQPGSILQVWRDDRNKVQWWTFWIAFVLFWLTVMSDIEGALQVYKAYFPTPIK